MPRQRRSRSLRCRPGPQCRPQVLVGPPRAPRPRLRPKTAARRRRSAQQQSPGQAAGGRRSNPVRSIPRPARFVGGCQCQHTDRRSRVALAGATAAPDKAGSSDAWGRAPIRCRSTRPAQRWRRSSLRARPSRLRRSRPRRTPTNSWPRRRQRSVARPRDRAGWDSKPSPAPTEAATADEAGADKGSAARARSPSRMRASFPAPPPPRSFQIAEGLAQVDAERASAPRPASPSRPTTLPPPDPALADRRLSIHRASAPAGHRFWSSYWVWWRSLPSSW